MPPDVAAYAGALLRRTPAHAFGCAPKAKSRPSADVFRVRVPECQIEQLPQERSCYGRRVVREHGSSLVAPAPFRIDPVVIGSSAPREPAAARCARVLWSRPVRASQLDARNASSATAATVFNDHIRIAGRRPSPSVPTMLASRPIRCMIGKRGKGCVAQAQMSWRDFQTLGLLWNTFRGGLGLWKGCCLERPAGVAGGCCPEVTDGKATIR